MEKQCNHGIDYKMGEKNEFVLKDIYNAFYMTNDKCI